MGPIIAFGIAFVVCAVIAGVIAPANVNSGFKDAASVLAFISLAAVTIERIIEGFFSMLAGQLGEWWPLKLVRSEFDRFEAQTNELLGPVVATTLQGLATARDVAGKTKKEIAQIQGLIDHVVAEQTRLSARYEEVTSKLNAGSARLARVSEINTEMARQLQAVHAASGQATASAQALMRDATDIADRASLIIASFQDNPARRIASIVLGASLGMLVAGGVGLNLFVATLVPASGNASNLPAVLAGALGVVLSGIIIGLGSAPTHEIVKSLQAYRDARTPPDDVSTVTTAGQPTEAVAAAFPAMLEAPQGALQAGFGATSRVREVRRTG